MENESATCPVLRKDAMESYQEEICLDKEIIRII
jgi:hypothetical protein